MKGITLSMLALRNLDAVIHNANFPTDELVELWERDGIIHARTFQDCGFVLRLQEPIWMPVDG